MVIDDACDVWCLHDPLEYSEKIRAESLNSGHAALLEYVPPAGLDTGSLVSVAHASPGCRLRVRASIPLASPLVEAMGSVSFHAAGGASENGIFKKAPRHEVGSVCVRRGSSPAGE